MILKGILILICSISFSYFIAKSKCIDKKIFELPSWCYSGMRYGDKVYCDEDRDLCICKGALIEDTSRSVTILEFQKLKYPEVHAQKGWECRCK